MTDFRSMPSRQCLTRWRSRGFLGTDIVTPNAIQSQHFSYSKSSFLTFPIARHISWFHRCISSNSSRDEWRRRPLVRRRREAESILRPLCQRESCTDFDFWKGTSDSCRDRRYGVREGKGVWYIRTLLEASARISCSVIEELETCTTEHSLDDWVLQTWESDIWKNLRYYKT